MIEINYIIVIFILIGLFIIGDLPNYEEEKDKNNLKFFNISSELLYIRNLYFNYFFFSFIFFFTLMIMLIDFFIWCSNIRLFPERYIH